MSEADELNEMVRSLAKERGVPYGIYPDMVGRGSDIVRRGGEEERRQALAWRAKLLAELEQRPDWVARWREQQALNQRIEALCAEKGYTFKPWEWPRPWHVDGPPQPDDDAHTRKARRLRELLIAELGVVE